MEDGGELGGLGAFEFEDVYLVDSHHPVTEAVPPLLRQEGSFLNNHPAVWAGHPCCLGGESEV